MSDCIFFLLGAGASFDSGLPTYRGPEGLYNEVKDPENLLNVESPLETVWNFLIPLFEKIKETQPGPTYELIKELGKKYPNSFLFTQNIDGHAFHTELPVVEMHGNWSKMFCTMCDIKVDIDPKNRNCICGGKYKPDIVLYGQGLPEKKVTTVHQFIKRHPKYVIVIGTTLQFPYLRQFITKAKMREAKVIHINPDDNYSKNVMFNELWIKLPSKEGLVKLLEIL